MNEWETVTLICQGLDALNYMHSLGIAHRDLKPENILVHAREPGSAFSIKIADFGLAIDQSDMQTVCGTSLYCAPEIWKHSIYSAAVDIRSLGVVALQYRTRLPHFSHKESTGEISWHAQLVQRAVDHEPDALVHLLSSCMLQLDPRDRRSAADCFEKAMKILAKTPSDPDPDIDPGTPTEAMSSSIIMRGLRNCTYKRAGDEQTTVDLASFPSLPTIVGVQNSIYDGPYVFELSDLNEEPRKSRDTSNSSMKRRRLEKGRLISDSQRQSSWARWQDQVLRESNVDSHIEVTVGGRIVTMRKSDCHISVTDLFKLARSDNAERIRVRKLIREHDVALQMSGGGASTA